jgi:hypothetical protein
VWASHRRSEVATGAQKLHQKQTNKQTQKQTQHKSN